MVEPYQHVKRSLKRSAIVKPRSRSRSPIFFQMAIAIPIFDKDRDRDRDLNCCDRANALVIHYHCAVLQSRLQCTKIDIYVLPFQMHLIIEGGKSISKIRKSEMSQFFTLKAFENEMIFKIRKYKKSENLKSLEEKQNSNESDVHVFLRKINITCFNTGSNQGTPPHCCSQ